MLRILGESGLINESERNGLLRQMASTKTTSATTTTAAPSITTRRSTFFSDLVTTSANKGDNMKNGKKLMASANLNCQIFQIISKITQLSAK